MNMMTNDPPGNKAAVLGLGISGIQTALFLREKGFEVFVSDSASSPELEQKLRDLRKAGIEGEIGGHTPEKILAADWTVISPGIPPTAPVYRALREKGKLVFSEIEVASWFCPSENIIAVTGSSGKTTVSTLLARSLKNFKGRSFLCGNIGNPWIGELGSIRPDDFVVLEVSSFQLAHCRAFRPRLGILLNLSPNHQDWHPDMQDYVKAKLKIFQNQTPEDRALFRESDRREFFPDFKFKARTYCFDKEPGTNPNEAVVLLAAKLLGCPEEIVKDVFRHFEGIEHRLEKAGSVSGVDYVNDSKCTTTASLAWALEKFRDGSVVLLAGGHPKSNDFANVRGLVSRKVRKAFLIGEAQPLLQEAWQGACELGKPDGFETAVREASLCARPGDTVLLSPACASFDMFKNYQERGNLFKKIVADLKESSRAEARTGGR